LKRLARLLAAVAILLGPVALAVGPPAGAVGTLTADPTSVEFGDVRVGTLQVAVLHLTNNSGGDITVHRAANEGGQAQDFAGVTGVNETSGMASSADDCLKNPDGVTDRTLANGESCTFFLFAYPTGTGTRTTALKVYDPSDNVLVSVTLTANGTEGYYLGGAFGEVARFGDAGDYGDATSLHLNAPIVDIQQVPFSEGYWLLGGDGGVFSYGPDAHFLGSTGGKTLNAPVVGMAPRGPDGYYLAAKDGGVFAYGAEFLGSMGGQPLNAPVVGMAVDPRSNGYWLVASDGGVFTFGEAHFHGSTGGKPLNAPIVGMAPTPDGSGYWLVGSDGGVFAYDAPFFGSLGDTANSGIVDIVASPTGLGYWLVGKDGGVFAYGDAVNFGNKLGADDVVGMTGTAPPTDITGLGGFYVSVNDQSLATATRKSAQANAKAAAAAYRQVGHPTGFKAAARMTGR
jgi:hypothetical protein